MKKFNYTSITKLLFLTILLLSISGFAQMPGGMPPGGAARTGGPGNIGHVYGKLTDADGKGVSGASVMLMRNKMDSVTKKSKEVLLRSMAQ